MAKIWEKIAPGRARILENRSKFVMLERGQGG